ncbi:MAG: hypothetical protein JNM96_04760 [Bacteroidia bacterium]|nr:hypothetical protein [Bacteroidia bacterium]
MTEDLKNQLMQRLHLMAQLSDIPNAEAVSFKKRNVLLELLQTKDEKGHQLINNLINAALKLDRIQNDKEKQEKKADHWSLEIQQAQQEYAVAEEKVNAFLKI